MVFRRRWPRRRRRVFGRKMRTSYRRRSLRRKGNRKINKCAQLNTVFFKDVQLFTMSLDKDDNTPGELNAAHFLHEIKPREFGTRYKNMCAKHRYVKFLKWRYFIKLFQVTYDTVLLKKDPKDPNNAFLATPGINSISNLPFRINWDLNHIYTKGVAISDQFDDPNFKTVHAGMKKAVQFTFNVPKHLQHWVDGPTIGAIDVKQSIGRYLEQATNSKNFAAPRYFVGTASDLMKNQNEIIYSDRKEPPLRYFLYIQSYAYCTFKGLTETDT
ncbi:putative capsid protein [Cybaeus spider associated circular virus 1]|uniref:Putative capsid protein n=1 Tax=Cybaeus spider associated circular virus 1 TaxID=2293277 RepID=A0A346BPA9_9VIRU|nr:putative capsid protein [Cybaeus spider associated circular virus 1]AXL65906.1 putative capsid protein [Cybaeus spider associated circular virus 1]